MPLEKRDTTQGFEPTLPSTPDVVRPCHHALRMDGLLEQGTLSPAIHQLLLNMARVKNVVSSLRLENVDVDLEQARRVVERSESLNPRDREVFQFAQRYAWVHDTPVSELPAPSIELVEELHEACLAGDPDMPAQSIGQLKQRQNAIIDRTSGQERFIPTPPDRVEDELGALFEWFSDASGRHPPGLVAATFFAEFQAIHPFEDGNGRIGRLLNVLILKLLGHEYVALTPLDGRFYATHDRYYDTLASTNDGETWHVWCRYFAQQLERAYEIAVRRADLEPIIDQQSGQVARDVLAWVLEGSGEPFKRGDYPNPGDYSGSAITRALGELAEQGILTPEGEKKGRTYRLSTDFLERVYGGLADPD